MTNAPLIPLIKADSMYYKDYMDVSFKLKFGRNFEILLTNLIKNNANYTFFSLLKDLTFFKISKS